MNRAKLIEKLEECCNKILLTWAFDPVLREKFKRIRSIIRRLKRCNQCLRGKVPELEECGRPWMEYQVLVWEDCPRCNGTGRIA